MNIIIYNCKHASVLVRMIIDMDHHRLIVIPPLNTVTRLQLQYLVQDSGALDYALSTPRPGFQVYRLDESVTCMCARRCMYAWAHHFEEDFGVHEQHVVHDAPSHCGVPVSRPGGEEDYLRHFTFNSANKIGTTPYLVRPPCRLIFAIWKVAASAVFVLP